MGVGYLWFHSVEDNIPNDWHYNIKSNEVDIRINASLGFIF